MSRSRRSSARRQALWLLLTPVLVLTVPLQRTTGSPSPLGLTEAVDAFRQGRCGAHLAALEAMSAGSDPTSARAAYLLGRCLLRAGRAAEAAAAFDAASRRHRTLAGYAAYYAALSFLRSGAPAEAETRLSALLAQAPARPLADRARLARSEALLGMGKAADAEVILRSLTGSGDTESCPARSVGGAAEPGFRAAREREAEIWWWRAVAAEQMGIRARAAFGYAMVWWGFPRTPRTEEAGRRLRRLTGGDSSAVPAEARLARARWLLSRGRTGEGERELATLLRAGAGGAVAAEAWFCLGFVRWRSAEAAAAFLRAADHPRWTPRALYWAGRAFAAAGRPANARQAWQRIVSEHAETVWAPRVMLRLARGAEAGRQWDAADRALEMLALRYPRSPEADEARWRRGWLRYERNAVREAEEVFTSAAHEFPHTPYAAANLFWAGRSRDRLTRATPGRNGEEFYAEAARLYPHTFYGQRAATRLGLSPPSRPPAIGPPPLPLDRYVSAHEELAALGFDAEAAAQAATLVTPGDDPQIVRFVAQQWAALGETHRALAAALPVVEAAQRGKLTADRALWSLAYPRGEWEIVQQASRSAGLDPYLVLAVIREESRFDPEALSFAGAAGLMQLLPRTASMSTEALFDPRVNVTAGAAYLGRQVRQFHGDLLLALAAYNAGPGTARRLGRAPRRDPEAFIEAITPLETRAYVKRVLESYTIYRWLY